MTTLGPPPGRLLQAYIPRTDPCAASSPLLLPTMSVGASDSSQPAQGIFLSDGLAGHDHRAMSLMYMFELARPQHPDILSGYPSGPEFFAFVDQARFFGVIIDAGVSAPENNWGEAGAYSQPLRETQWNEARVMLLCDFCI